jgi:hypothetical protein
MENNSAGSGQHAALSTVLIPTSMGTLTVRYSTDFSQHRAIYGIRESRTHTSSRGTRSTTVSWPITAAFIIHPSGDLVISAAGRQRNVSITSRLTENCYRHNSPAAPGTHLFCRPNQTAPA